MPNVSSLSKWIIRSFFSKAQGWSHMSICQANRPSRMLHPHSRLWVRQERKFCLPLWSLPGAGNEFCTPEIVKQELTLRGVVHVVKGLCQLVMQLNCGHSQFDELHGSWKTGSGPSKEGVGGRDTLLRGLLRSYPPPTTWTKNCMERQNPNWLVWNASFKFGFKACFKVKWNNPREKT